MSHGTLKPEEVAELRRWALRVSDNGADETLKSAAKAVVKLADQVERLSASAEGDDAWSWGEGKSGTPPKSPSPEQLAKARTWARSVLTNGSSSELKAAARAILLLSDDVEALQNGEARPRQTARASQPATETTRRRSSGGGFGPQVAIAHRRWRRTHPLTVLAALVPLLVLFLVFVLFRAVAPGLDPRGPSNGAVLGAAEVKTLTFSVDANDKGSVDWTLDGDDVIAKAAFADGRSTYKPGKLADGDHTVKARVGGLAPWSGASASWSFTVDSTPPKIAIPGNEIQVEARTPYVLKGTVEGDTTLTADGKPVELESGAFSLSFPSAPVEPVKLVAKDAAGNTTVKTVSFTLVPRRPTNPVRAVHVSADAWANDELRNGILQLIDEKKINTVQLDLKDESGIVGWPAGVPLAKKIGATQEIYDLQGAVKQLHDKGVRVIGRLVAFRDPILGEWAWNHGKQDMVVQAPGGGAYTGGGYGDYSFTNFADPDVRAYNVAIAAAAAKIGVDDILYDYVRRPDGPIEEMVFPNLKGEADQSIADFLAETQKALAPSGAYLGASVFGIAVSRPDETAQNIPLMAQHADYIAPLIYPSHWGPGEYGLATPESQPYEIVNASIKDFKRAVRGTGARIVPWLQDFSLAVEYGPDEVSAQIKGAAAAGISEFVLWDPEVTYTSAGIPATAKFPATGNAEVKTKAFNRPEPKSLVAVPKEGPVDSGLAPNELGQVPVLMYHQIVPDGGSEYDLTPDQFRAELDRLWKENYRPITAADLVNGTIDVPKGTTPVVMTFDDGSSSQIAFQPDGSVDPSTAVGIMLDFAKTHRGFRPAATFYVNGEPFGVPASQRASLFSWLTKNGFDVGNHTLDHANLSDLSSDDVQKQFMLENRVIQAALPDYEVTTMALPFGVMPDPASLAVEGTWDGESYAFKGVMLVGANPAPSPFSTSFDGAATPRIRSSPPDEKLENGSTYWLDQFAANPEARFVSDGDPNSITVPSGETDQVAQQFRSKVTQG